MALPLRPDALAPVRADQRSTGETFTAEFRLEVPGASPEPGLTSARLTAINRSTGSELIRAEPMQIVSAASRECAFTFEGSSDTLYAGDIEAFIESVDGDGKRRRYPQAGAFYSIALRGETRTHSASTLAAASAEAIAAAKKSAAGQSAVEAAITGTDPAGDQTLAGGQAQIAALPAQVSAAQQASAEAEAYEQSAAGSKSAAQDAAERAEAAGNVVVQTDTVDWAVTTADGIVRIGIDSGGMTGPDAPLYSRNLSTGVIRSGTLDPAGIVIEGVAPTGERVGIGGYAESDVLALATTDAAGVVLQGVRQDGTLSGVTSEGGGAPGGTRTAGIDELIARGSSRDVTSVLTPHAPLWQRGVGGYDTYRIPTLARLASGLLVATCEARADGAGDHGQIDVVYRTSSDEGQTWTPSQVAFTQVGARSGGGACLYDDQTDTLYIISLSYPSSYGLAEFQNSYQGNELDHYLLAYDEASDTWGTPVLLPAFPAGVWYGSVSPSRGIRIQQGPHAGRLVQPFWGFEEDGAYPQVYGVPKSVWSLYSDDGGATWTHGQRTIPSISTGFFPNEASVVELASGELLMLARNEKNNGRKKLALRSSDGGLTWSQPTESVITDNDSGSDGVQGHLLRASGLREGEVRRLLYSTLAHETLRRELAFWQSFDEGETWQAPVIIDDGPSAYSAPVMLGRDTVGIAYERGDFTGSNSTDYHKQLAFRTVTLDYLTPARKGA